jgi:hypothetical protein
MSLRAKVARIAQDEGWNSSLRVALVQALRQAKLTPKELKEVVEEHDLDLKVDTTELIAFSGDIPEYRLEIVAGGAGGDLTEVDLQRAREIKDKIAEGFAATADVCKLSPAVCKGNLGVERASMPQIMDKPVSKLLASKDALDRKKGQAAVDAGADPDDDRSVLDQFKTAIKKEGVKVAGNQRRNVRDLKATQKEIKAEKTYSLADAYLKGEYDPTEHPLILSDDDYVLDGHHHYAAMITANPDAEMKAVIMGLPIRELLRRALEQPGVFRLDLQDNVVSLDEPVEFETKMGSRSLRTAAIWLAAYNPGVLGRAVLSAVNNRRP